MNPFAKKLAAAQKKLERLVQENERLNRNAIPGTFVTGRSGVSRSYSKRLDRQLDRTIELSKQLIAARGQVKWLERCVRLYDQGKIDAQGRSITTPAKTQKSKRAVSSNAKIMRTAIAALSMDGVFTLPTGHKIEVLVDWDGSEAQGIILVTDQAGNETRHIAKSIQGIDLEMAQRVVIKNLLNLLKTETH